MRTSMWEFCSSLAACVALACGTDGYGTGLPTPTGGTARAYGLWTPSARETCTKAAHDKYSTVGPDGKLYPTWHPPTDTDGCTFGHEHGRDRAAPTFIVRSVPSR